MDSTRLIFKMANNSLLSVIKQLILTKFLNFMMRKVKGHLGVEYNDKADFIAKEAVVQVMDGTLGVVNLLNSEVGHRINFNLTWNNVVIDSNLQRFNRLVSNSIANSHWSLANIWNSLTWNNT